MISSGDPSALLPQSVYSHGYWFYLLQTVDKELLGDIVPAVGILEGEVELVLLIQHFQTVGIGSGTVVGAACSVDVHWDVLG